MDIETDQKLELQEDQYAFPYHYIPHQTTHDEASRIRALGWGFEYLCYQNHVIQVVKELAPESVLEVGCGDGYFIGALGDEIKYRTGVDFSAKAVGFARAFHPDVDFHVGNAAHIEQQFDVVAAVEVLEHIPDEQVRSFLRVLFDRVKPGGHVIITVPSVVLPLNRKHFRHYTTDLLREQVMNAYPGAEAVREQYVCRVPRWMEIYNKLTANRHWVVEIRTLSSRVWRRLWNRHRFAGPSTGRHVVGLFRKPKFDSVNG